jgi:hypothetical protein
MTAGGEGGGPSPLLLSGVPLWAPLSYLAVPVGVAKSSLLVLVSKARKTVPLASEVRATTVKTFPSHGTNQVSPAEVGTRHKKLGAPIGQSVRIVSGEPPPVCAPRYRFQSTAIPAAPLAREAQPATTMLHQRRAPPTSVARSRSYVGKPFVFIRRLGLPEGRPGSEPGIGSRRKIRLGT